MTETFNTRAERDARYYQLKAAFTRNVIKSTSERQTNGAYFRRYREATKNHAPSKAMLRTPRAMTWTLTWGTDTI